MSSCGLGARYKETQRLEKEAKKREELERYKQNHVNSIHTPGASGNLVPRYLEKHQCLTCPSPITHRSIAPLPLVVPYTSMLAHRVGATKSAVKKAAGAPLSAKKPAAAYPPNVPVRPPVCCIALPDPS
jgi:hypothetical protein